MTKTMVVSHSHSVCLVFSPGQDIGATLTLAGATQDPRTNQVKVSPPTTTITQTGTPSPASNIGNKARQIFKQL